MPTCPGLPGCPMSAVDTDPHTLCPHCRGKRCDSGNSSAEETTRRSPILPATTLDVSGDSSRSPSEEGRPSGPCDQSPSRPANLPSPFEDADAHYVPPKPAIAQAPVPSGHKGLERKTVPHTLKRQVKPAFPHAAAAIPDLAPQRSPACVRAPVPVTRQGSPARPQPTAPRRPPAVSGLARQRSPAHTHTRPPAPQRPPVPVKSRAIQEAPRLAHRCSKVPLDSQRPSGVRREARPAHAVPDAAHTRSPTHQCASTSQRAVQEVPKLAHGRSQVPLDSPSRLRNLVRAPPVARDVPVARQVPVALEAPHATQQRTPVRPNPIARPVRPRSPQVNIPAQTAQRSPARQRADPPLRYHEAAHSRPRPVLPDTLPRATAPSHPTVPHQVTARPRIQHSTPPHDPAPARHTPSPSPARARALATNLARLRKREIPMAHDPPARSSSG
ncbi:serine/arginine repetitive matrix protein 1-like [Palaemon carinicauda]|uniref:serine/arginine repetitive matrix protein 1-like n=1 Tax=Palaemon carinicauda TaxID=392227 RepID=UPI0035B695B9